MADDYFAGLAKKTQPVRDMFKPKAPEAPKAPSVKPTTDNSSEKEGEMYPGQSAEDYEYMKTAVRNIGKKLAPKSVMGKSTSKR